MMLLQVGLGISQKCLASSPGPPPAFLCTTLKSWERVPGDKAKKCPCCMYNYTNIMFEIDYLTYKIQFQIPTPWLQILISPAVWAIIIAHFCNNWGFYTLLTCMPTYFKQVMPSLQIGKSDVSESNVNSRHFDKVWW